MDENELESSISSYKAQLSKIAEMLPTSDTITKLELYDLEKDLKEIIAVTEESLLTLKKNKNMLPEDTCSSHESPQDKDENLNNGIDEKEIDNDLQFVGMKCRVKYTQEWGSFQYHNAMILEYNENIESNDVCVRVLFLNPTHMSMVPCKYFMDGKCKFSDQECKFSHGYLVNIDELQEFEEPNFTDLAVGSQCLAKYDDNGVWYKATVSDIHEDQVTISFDTYSESRTLDFHDIFPVVSPNNSSSSSDSDSDFEFENSAAVQLTYKPGQISGPLGEWEEHTRGIGSKLMAKMGYIFGKGLGKDSQGRVDPVEIRLLPPGKSLDAILELREKGRIKDPTKRRKRKNKNVSKLTDDGKGSTTAAFELINRLTHKGSSDRLPSSSTQHKLKFGINDTYKQLKKDMHKQKSNDVRRKQSDEDHKNLNIHMFKNSEKISVLKKKLVKQKEALARNPGDTTISRTIKKNIDITRHEIEELSKIEKSLHDKLHMKQQSKKLSIF